jgi:hypothetical protein
VQQPEPLVAVVITALNEAGKIRRVLGKLCSVGGPALPGQVDSVGEVVLASPRRLPGG